ncbi:efflux RND transporter periplasmic adaptor subunit [Pedobacter sp. BS3]|uniref:efflux RND transporter periplasmic adaptor subunit n=1 Tax=Pedobacter sp. BS3 TaxID=2567937 RepID=UPI0011EC094A|nr:efflux RND transporter periplasmic adaptor subunit [Pedobacter sp. BS3]TZF84045.1 efflux RND transporter periplasmic adaptor subunit [Pedobacter sp. BS3]
MKTRYIIYSMLVIGLVALIGYRIHKNKEEGAGGGKGKGGGKQGNAPVRVYGTVVKTGTFANTLSLSGTLEANEEIKVTAEVSGIVRSINFQEGSTVSKGQVLLRIDDSELRAQLSQATTKQALAAQTEHRAKLLLQKEAISQEEYDTALADLKSQQAQTQLIQAQIAKTIIRAPFSGRIGLRTISVGDYVTPATVIANLVSINPLKVQLAVPEKYADRLKVGSALSFTVNGSTEKHTATIYALEPAIDANTRTLKLRAKVPNPDGKLLPGSFAKISLPLAIVKNAILIPSEAVIPVLNGKQVYVSKNGKAEQVLIETSERTDKDVLVTSGLHVGDTVLTSGIMALKVDMPVKVELKGR